MPKYFTCYSQYFFKAYSLPNHNHFSYCRLYRYYIKILNYLDQDLMHSKIVLGLLLISLLFLNLFQDYDKCLLLRDFAEGHCSNMFEHHYHSLLFLELLQDLLEIGNEMDPISKPIKTIIVLKITKNPLFHN